MATLPTPEYCIILSTAGDLTEAHRIADALVDANLAACVQLSQISSVYRWRDAIETAGEVRLTVKTRTALFDAAAATIRANHSYDTPQILRVDCAGGDADFLQWISDSTRDAETAGAPERRAP